MWILVFITSHVYLSPSYKSHTAGILHTPHAPVPGYRTQRPYNECVKSKQVITCRMVVLSGRWIGHLIMTLVWPTARSLVVSFSYALLEPAVHFQHGSECEILSYNLALRRYLGGGWRNCWRLSAIIW